MLATNDVIVVGEILRIMNTESTNTDQSVIEENFVHETPLIAVADYGSTVAPDNFGVTDEATIKKFLERPFLISSTTAGSFDLEFAPWDSFLRNQFVIDKIRHFRFIKGTMNMRVTTSCNAYTYGKLLVYNEYGQHLDPDIIRGFNAEHQVLDLATKDNCVFKMPLFWKYPYIHTNQEYAFEWERPVITHIIDITALKLANGNATPSVVVNVYLWLTDVELAISEVIDYEAQPVRNPISSANFTRAARHRGYKKIRRPRDPRPSRPLMPALTAYDSEPESDIRPVSTPLKIGASMLKQGGEAIRTGTSMAHAALNIAANIASAAGYSRPQAVDNTSGYLPRLFDDTASVTGPVQALSVTLNPETLVTSVHGAGIDDTDELSLSSMMSRDSLFLMYTILPGSAFQKTFPVLPCWYEKGTVPNSAQLTNMAYACAPFRYWRGSIDYTFHVTASNFHSGRFGVLWQPVEPLTFDPKASLQVAPHAIFDVSAGQSVTVRVNWARSHAYATTALVSIDDVDSFIDYEYTNGELCVFLIDQIIAPDPGATVTLIVTMKPGPDFELVVPDGHNLRNMNWTNTPDSSIIASPPTSIAVPEITFPTVGPRYPTYPSIAESQPIVIDLNSPVSKEVNSRHVGERVTSFRALTKRFNYNFCTTAGEGTDGYYFSIPLVGIAPGTQMYEEDPPGTLTKVMNNDAQMGIIQYLIPAFAGYRGSTYAQIRNRRLRGAANGAVQPADNKELFVFQGPVKPITRGAITNLNAGTEMGVVQTGQIRSFTINGAQSFDLVKSAATVHIPFTSPADYYECIHWTDTAPSAVTTRGVYAVVVNPREALQWNNLEVYYATGDDFDLLHFNGPPPCYFYMQEFS